MPQSQCPAGTLPSLRPMPDHTIITATPHRPKKASQYDMTVTWPRARHPLSEASPQVVYRSIFCCQEIFDDCQDIFNVGSRSRTYSSLVRLHAPNSRLVNSGPKRTGMRYHNNEMAVAVLLRE